MFTWKRFLRNNNHQVFSRLRFLISFFILVNSTPFYSQLSDLHYLPPLKQESNGIGFDKQAIYLSTPELTPFTVKVYQGTSTTSISSFTLSNASPYIYSLGAGDNNVTLVNNTNTGSVLSNSGLRFESENGEKFYVNWRGAQSAQGSSLTSKGRAALGKRFRWGGGPVIYGDNTNATLGMMASEDGTTINVFGYDPGIVFRRGNDVDGITDDELTITLDKGQSFVLEYPIHQLSTYSDATLYDEWMGASIISDKDIAVSLGNALYSPTFDGSRDIAIDQIIPENVLGNEYVFVRGYGVNSIEFAIIIATQNGTEIFVNDALTSIATIDAGEYYIVPGTNYSGSGNGENMYVRTSKQAYAYQSTAGAPATANVDYNFVAPVNFLLDSEVNFIPGIDNVGPVSKIDGGVFIISAASTDDSDVQVYVKPSNVTSFDNSHLQSLSGKRKSVSGTNLWVTYFLDNLEGDVKVVSTNSIAVGFMGKSGVIGVSGYFSGFETIPSISVDVNVVGECLQDGNVSLTAPQGYSIYQWYLEGNPVSGATESSYVPTLPGSYTVGITQTADGKEYVSAPVDVSDCLPEIKLDVTSSSSTLTVNNTATLRVNYKYQSFFDALDAEVSLTIPSNFSVVGSSPSTGSWDNDTKKWSIGTVNPGNEEILELTLQALSVGNPVTITATNSQTVLGSDNTTVLDEGQSVADDLSEVFIIKDNTQIVVTTPITKTVLDDDFNLSATSNNTNPIIYSSSNEGIAKVSSTGDVELISAGIITLSLSQTESLTHGAGSATVSLTVSKVSPTLTSFSDVVKTYGDPDFQLLAPTSTSDGTFTYTSSDNSVATVISSTGEITIVGAGNATITATQTATPNYNAASISATLTVNPADQIITIGALPDEKTVLERVGSDVSTKEIIPINPTSTSGSSVTMTLGAGTTVPSVTINGSPGNYTIDEVSSAGLLVLDFSAPSTLNYNAASTSITLDVSKKPQNILFDPGMPTTEVYSEGLSIPITATSASSTDMIYAIESGPATISAGNIIVNGTGTIAFSVNNDGDAIYSKAPEIKKTLEITQGITALSNFTVSDQVYGVSDFDIPVPTSNRSGDFIYSSDDPTIAAIADGKISVNTPGTVTITASQPATSNWTGANISTTFDVLKATPNITGASAISKKTIDSDFSYEVVSSVPENPFTFRSSDLSVATINSTSGLINIKGIGTTTITVSQEATSNYNAASKTLTLTVTKADPTLGALSNIQKILGSSNFTISPPTSNSGGAFSFSSSDTGVATIDSSTGEVTLVSTGTTTITISQAATASFNTASTTLSLVVNVKIDPTLGDFPNIAKVYGDSAFTISPPTSDSGGGFSFSSSDTGVATINSVTGEVNVLSVGTTTITVSQEATSNYNAASKTLTLTVTKADPTLGALSNIQKILGSSNFTISPPTSNSGGAFSFSSSDIGVATIDSSTGEVTLVSTGTTTITISQAATASFNAASAALTLTVVNADNTPPNISGSTSIKVFENTVSIETYSANEAVTWVLGGDDRALFSISSSGTLEFKNAPDFELPEDLNKDNIYKITLLASDANNNTASQELIIEVLDVDEIVPMVIGDQDLLVFENTIDVIRYESDESVTWFVEGIDDSLFEIDPISGLLSFRGSPDFENPKDSNEDNIYEIVVKAIDESNNVGELDVTISILDVDEIAPTIIGSRRPLFVSENSLEVKVFTADETVTWQIDGDDADVFEIEPNEGELSFKEAPDYENPKDKNKNNIYELVVKAIDASFNESKLDVSVTVFDIDEDTDGDGILDSIDPNPTSPTALPDAASPVLNGPTVIDLLNNDDFVAGLDNELTLVGGTAQGDVVFDAMAGTMSYTPLPEEAGTTVTVIYQVCHKGVCATATVTLDIEPDADGDGIGDSADPDDDNDGVEDIYDNCPGTPAGTQVDINGCALTELDANDFSVGVTSASCTNLDDGALALTATDTRYSYQVTVSGQTPFTLNTTSGYSKTLTGLGAGSYTVCFTAEGLTDATYCYTVAITQPEALSVDTQLIEDTQQLKLSLQGAAQYTVELNGQVSTYDKASTTLNLKTGLNRLRIYTDNECQGVIEQEVFVSEVLEYAPNPVLSYMDLFIGGSDREVELTLSNLSGGVIWRSTVTVPTSRIYRVDMNRHTQGTYILQAKGQTVRKTIKVIKR